LRPVARRFWVSEMLVCVLCSESRLLRIGVVREIALDMSKFLSGSFASSTHRAVLLD
jgi:hypothetical protein